jgi:hypothetical protein
MAEAEMSWILADTTGRLYRLKHVLFAWKMALCGMRCRFNASAMLIPDIAFTAVKSRSEQRHHAMRIAAFNISRVINRYSVGIISFNFTFHR